MGGFSRHLLCPLRRAEASGQDRHRAVPPSRPRRPTPLGSCCNRPRASRRARRHEYDPGPLAFRPYLSFLQPRPRFPVSSLPSSSGNVPEPSLDRRMRNISLASISLIKALLANLPCRLRPAPRRMKMGASSHLERSEGAGRCNVITPSQIVHPFSAGSE